MKGKHDIKELDFEPYVFTGSSQLDQNCYVCKDPASVSIRALTESGREAVEIQEMYRVLGLYATIIPHDKKSPDIVIAGCNDHFSNLKKLEDYHRETKKISTVSIVASLSDLL